MSDTAISTIRGDLLSLTTTARKIGVCSRALRQWIYDQKCPIGYRIIGGQYKFDSADIDDYLAAIYVPAATYSTSSVKSEAIV
jgi:hypothetical protein